MVLSLWPQQVNAAGNAARTTTADNVTINNWHDANALDDSTKNVGRIWTDSTKRIDISWQMNAMMPERKLYLFDTFTGYDERDIAKEQELRLSDAKPGEYSLSRNEQDHLNERILGRMPYAEQVELRPGWFPETAFELEHEKYALVHIDTGLYAPTYSGIQYFFPRLSKGGVILVSGYTDGKSQSVCQAVRDLEAEYGAFLITPLCDIDGTIMIMRP